MTRWLLTLLMLCGLCAPALAEPGYRLVGDYRPLRASDQAVPADSFEQQLAARLLAQWQPGSALTLGAQPEGAVLYASRAAALTAGEGGLKNWAALRGQPFCVTAGSPHAETVARLYGGQPRAYPSTAHALNGLKLGECRAVVEDERLLRDIAGLPEWRRYNRLLPPLKTSVAELRAAPADPAEQAALEKVVATLRKSGELDSLTQTWVHEVAFQAYVLADTLDCH
ncbi:type 2 periplasmic-binding domain-containing protein [Stutzerimonas azotifigens]|uniref:transporter substrate-binding domain-containing protein n=1 Tax=Stutzerimonas azotifigens TaxID=291995 RepID=UPI000423081F|nr:transporter substrate-binding domain-containing protein [Stutzerimonas azotifigens]